MRRWGLGVSGVVAIVAVIAIGLSWRSGEPPEASEVASRPTRALSKKWAGAHAAPTPPPSGSLRIRGTVRDEHGPVAGAHVSATRPMPGETLSELPCPSRSEGRGSSGLGERKLPDCMDVAGDLILELVGAREGEAPLYAETVTAADGSFILEGLPEGDFSLWALGPRGAELRPGVKAGAQDVELVLEEGVTLEGTGRTVRRGPLRPVST